MTDPKATTAPTDGDPIEISTDELDTMSGSGTLLGTVTGATNAGGHCLYGCSRLFTD